VAFGAEFNDGLERLNPDPALRAALAAQMTQLAEMRIPEDTAPDLADDLDRLIESAFLVGFRLVMWIAAALTAACSVIAWLTVREREEGRASRLSPPPPPQSPGTGGAPPPPSPEDVVPGPRSSPRRRCG